MKKSVPLEKQGRRGRFALGYLTVALILAAGAALTLTASSGSPRAFTASSPACDRAKAAYADGDLARAEEILREVLASAPADRAAKLLLARVLLARGRLAESRRILMTILGEEKDYYPAVCGVAEVSEALNQPDVAAMWWRRAASINSKDAEPQVRLARVLHKKGDSPGAMAALQRARAIDPKREDVEALFQEILEAQAAPANPPGIPHAGGVSMPPRPQAPNPRTSVPIPQPPDPLKGYPTGGNPR